MVKTDEYYRSITELDRNVSKIKSAFGSISDETVLDTYWICIRRNKSLS
jgi:hypothetical protein